MVLNGVRIYQLLIKIFQNFTKLIKNYDEDSNEGDILEVVIEYLKYLHDMHTVYHSYLKEPKLINAVNLDAIFITEKYVIHIRNLK